MNPLTLSEIQALLAQPAGNLKPYQLDLLCDALNRRYWDHSNPVTSQETLSAIAARWTN